jgi:Lectin C-type domain
MRPLVLFQHLTRTLNLIILKMQFKMFDLYQKSWNAAQSDCCSRNMHLVAFETIQEQNCVRDNVVKSILMNRIIFKLFTNYSALKARIWLPAASEWWIGATDYCQEDSFLWCYQNLSVVPIDRPSITFSPVEPNNYGGNEHCLHFESISRWQVNDNACAVSYNYICEVMTKYSDIM